MNLAAIVSSVVATVAVIGLIAIIVVKTLSEPKAALPAPDNLATVPEPDRKSASRPVRSTRDIVAQCEGGVAKLEGKLGSGTGFVAAPGIVATNAHVINQELISNLKATFSAGSKNSAGQFAVRLIYKDTPRDLALLQIETSLAPLDLARLDAFPKGEDVIIIGNPGGLGGLVQLDNAVTRGVLSTEAEFLGQQWYQLSMSVNPGNSGGPVIDSRGRVVGIVTIKARKEEGHGYCIPVGALLTALDKVVGISAKQRLRVEDRHAAQSVFQIYRALSNELVNASVLHLLVSSRDLKSAQSAEAQKVVALYMEKRRSLKGLNELVRTDYANALVRVIDDNETDNTVRQDLNKLCRLVDNLGDALDHCEASKLDEFARTIETTKMEFQRLSGRLSNSLDVSDN